MSDESKQSEPGAFFAHCPLPYYVRLRVAVSDDALPTVIERQVNAYSVFEAMMQVLLEAGGQSLDGQRYVIEEIRPDLAAYIAQFAREATKAR